MNVDLVQTLSLFSLDIIQKTYCKPNEQLFPMGDHAIGGGGGGGGGLKDILNCAQTFALDLIGVILCTRNNLCSVRIMVH